LPADLYEMLNYVKQPLIGYFIQSYNLLQYIVHAFCDQGNNKKKCLVQFIDVIHINTTNNRIILKLYLNKNHIVTKGRPGPPGYREIPGGLVNGIENWPGRH